MKGFFEYEYLSFKKEYLKNLVALINAQGQMSEEEFNYLYKVGESYELKPRHIDSILAKKEDLKPAIPASHEARVNQLYDFIQAMFINGISSEKDLSYLNKLVLTFGFKESFSQQLIEYYNHKPHQDKDWDSFIENAKNYNL